MHHLIKSRLCSICTTIFLVSLILYKGLYIIVIWNTPCFYSNEGDSLPSADDPSFSPEARAIYFHESSCRGGLNVRQACAVEAAARAHPQWNVNVLFNSPVSHHTMQTSCLAQLHTFSNIKFLRVHIEEYSKGTIVEPVLLNGLKDSVYPVLHSSDILRILTLHKWGGIYLDTDMIVTRSLDDLPLNFFVKENDGNIATGIIALAKDDVGRNVTETILKEMYKAYKPKCRTCVGGVMIDRVVQRLCPELVRSQDFENKFINYCESIAIYDYELFYTIYYPQFMDIFRPPDRSFDLERPYTYHMWNFITSNETIKKGSVYEIVAMKYCPTIHATYSKDSGLSESKH